MAAQFDLLGNYNPKGKIEIMSMFKNAHCVSASFLLTALFSLAGCGGGSGGGGTAVVNVNSADIIGSWKMVSFTPPGGSAVDMTPYSQSLVSNAATYTYISPVSIPGGHAACFEYGTWSVSGNSMTTTPITGSTCGNSATTYSSVSVSGSTMSMSDASGTYVYQRQTAASVSGNALLGTWKIMAMVNTGTVSPINQVASAVTLNASTYSISLPSCSETGTWSVSGSTLGFAVNPGSTCGSSPTYTETVNWNNPLLTLNLSSTAQNVFWLKLPDTPASPVAAGANGAVNLSWQAVSGASGYKVYRAGASGALTSKTEIGTATGTSYQDATAVAGNTYYYQVTAVDAYGESLPSAEVSGAATAIPSPVSGLTATAGAGQVFLSWNAVSGATSYKVYGYSTGIGICNVFVPDMTTSDYPLTGWGLLGSTTLTSTTVNGTTAGICYQFMVTAVNAYGESLSMSYVDATPF